MNKKVFLAIWMALICVAGWADVAANFHATPTTGVVGQTISFFDDSTGTPTSWLWNFGDSSTSALKNPTHSYSSATTYTVSLRVEDGSTTDTETKIGYITINPSPPPTPSPSPTATATPTPSPMATSTPTPSPTPFEVAGSESVQTTFLGTAGTTNTLRLALSGKIQSLYVKMPAVDAPVRIALEDITTGYRFYSGSCAGSATLSSSAIINVGNKKFAGSMYIKIYCDRAAIEGNATVLSVKFIKSRRK